MGRTQRSYKNMDFTLLVIVIFLICFGLVMLYSASSYNATVKTGDSFFYLKRQLRATALGLIPLAIFTFIPYQFWTKFTLTIYALSIILILLVKSPLGINVNGATRWVGYRSFSFQPAEFAKLALILVLAHIISRNIKDIYNFKVVLKILALVAVVALLLAVLTKNFSSALIVFVIAFVMIMVASPKKLQFVFIVVLAAIASAVLIATQSYRMDRINAWLHPLENASDDAYQVLQALYAIGSGGFFGKGLGNSIQKTGFVPEAQNDMIFTIICEELGLFGAICVILLFVFLIWRLKTNADKAIDEYGTLIVVGIMTHIAVQVILNIAVVTNSIPNTGVTLPFISYGGTSVMFLMAEVGLALSVSWQASFVPLTREQKREIREKEREQKRQNSEARL